MSKMAGQVHAFVESERNRFSERDNNIFGMSVFQVMRYHQFLSILLERHRQTSEKFSRVQKAFAKDSYPNGPLNDEQMATVKELNEDMTLLQLEVESFYLFAKILLDKVAHFVEFYFGKGRKLSLDSHDRLTKNLDAFSAIKRLDLPSDLPEIIDRLKTDISDHRDYEIAHEKSPRTIRCTSLTPEGKVSLIHSQVYPTYPLKQTETRPLDELFEDIEKYLEAIVTFARMNREKTALRTETENVARPVPPSTGSVN